MGGKADGAFELIDGGDGQIPQGKPVQQVGFNLLTELTAEQALGSHFREGCQGAVFCFRKFRFPGCEGCVVGTQSDQQHQPQAKEEFGKCTFFHGCSFQNRK